MQFQISFALGRTNQLFMTNQTNQQKLSSSTIIPLVMRWPNHDVVAMEDETHEKEPKMAGRKRKYVSKYITDQTHYDEDKDARRARLQKKYEEQRSLHWT